MKPVAVFRTCFALLSLLTSRATAYEVGSDKRLLQLPDGDVHVTTTEEELRNALSIASPRTEIHLDAIALTLSGPIVIDSQNVTLEGRADTSTVLTCPQNGNESAIVIRQAPSIRAPHRAIEGWICRNASVRLRHLNITQCKGESAVVVPVEPSNPKKERTEVAFEGVLFWRNGEEGGRVFGAAVRVDACGNRSCARPVIRFQSCRFFRNRGTLGGAIYARNAHVEIEDSEFEHNEADLTGGAVYLRHVRKTSLKIGTSWFVNNTARGESPLASSEEPSDQEIISYGILNTAGMGGAVFAANPANSSIQDSIFMNNKGCRAGGGIAVIQSQFSSDEDDNFTFHLQNNVFTENVAFCGPQPNALYSVFVLTEMQSGGALHYSTLHESPVNWTMRNCTFRRNQAQQGGAVALQGAASSTTDHHISACLFLENVALRSGGALFAWHTKLRLRSSIISRSQAALGGGVIIWREASLTTDWDPALPGQRTIIEDCIAGAAGGLMLSETGAIDLSALLLRNNTSYRLGGGMHAYSVAYPVVLRGVVFENNRALVGGGLDIYAAKNLTITSDEGQRTVFRNNSASVGGGLRFETGETIIFALTLEDTNFIANKALSMETPMMDKLARDGREFIPSSEAGVIVPDQREQLGNETLFSFLVGIPEGHGGGVCMVCLSMNLYTVAQITYKNVVVANNVAVIGGGVSLHMTDLYWNQRNTTDCFPPAFGYMTCQRFDVYNLTIANNTAARGGGVFSTSTVSVAVSCGPEQPKWIAGANVSVTSPSEQLKPYCFYMTNNTNLDTTISQAQAGTNVASLHAEGGIKQLAQMASGEALCVTSKKEASECDTPLRIMVKDVFNQTITGAIEDASLELTLESDAIIGDLRYEAVDGVAVISNTKAYGINRNSTLRIFSKRDPRIKIELQMSMRDCYPGEFEQGNVCNKCPVDQYGFDSTLNKCQSCEINAKCSGEAVLIPNDGYWHSTPFSPVFRKCIHSVACSYTERSEHLTLYYDDLAEVQKDLEHLDEHIDSERPEPNFSESYAQCADGYEGFLCGSCRLGYGHSYSGKCESCQEKEAMNSLFVFLGMVWLLVLIGINCAITLTTMSSRVRLVEHELRSLSANAADGMSDSDVRRNGQVPQPIESAGIEDGTSLGQALPQDGNVCSTRNLFATVQWTETLKVMHTASTLSPWNGLGFHGFSSPHKARPSPHSHAKIPILWLLAAALAGLITVLISSPYECNFSHEETFRSIAALWMRLATPWIVLTVLVSAFLFFWLFREIQKRIWPSEATTVHTNWTTFFTYIIVISIVSVYISYIDIVRELLRAVNCMEVDPATEYVDSDHPYLRYATEPVEFIWVEDTKIVCFEASHLPLGIVGFAGLFCAFSGVLCIVIWLPLNKSRITDTVFVSRYWFLYQAYRKEWYRASWESVILTRKAMIAAVVVFSVHLEPRLQATMCAGILVIAQALQCFLAPFKTFEGSNNVPDYTGWLLRLIRMPKLAMKWIQLNNRIDLNALESASLICSCLVFFAAVIILEPSSSGAGRSVMVSFAFAVNLVYLIYVLYRLYAGLHIIIDQMLSSNNPSFFSTHRSHAGLTGLSRKIARILPFWRVKNVSSDEDDNDCLQVIPRGFSRRLDF